MADWIDEFEWLYARRLDCCIGCSVFEYFCTYNTELDLISNCEKFRMKRRFQKENKPEMKRLVEVGYHFECQRCEGDGFILFADGKRFCDVCIGRGYLDWAEYARGGCRVKYGMYNTFEGDTFYTHEELNLIPWTEFDK